MTYLFDSPFDVLHMEIHSSRNAAAGVAHRMTSVYQAVCKDTGKQRLPVSLRDGHPVVIRSDTQAPLSPSNWSALYRGRGSPVMS